ncbi:MAG: hypothetical protein SV760_03615 [Halobacteria archaeon]|nr:hypothetical protein [Halobacteria archaeon]
MAQDTNVLSGRNAYFVAMFVAVGFLGYQMYSKGDYDFDVFSVLMVSQVAYWGSYLYYRRTRGSDEGERDGETGEEGEEGEVNAEGEDEEKDEGSGLWT